MSRPSFSKDDIPASEVSMEAIRAQGAGGQNVNKVASAIHLRFDVAASSLPDAVKARLLSSRDKRLTEDGVLVIKAQSHRTQLKNREEALTRLADIIDAAFDVPTPRIATRVSASQKRKRLDAKKQRSETKAARQPVRHSD